MAIRIPVLERQVAPPGEAAQPRQSPERAGALGGQVADASFALARQADQLDDRIRQQRDVIDVSRSVADARLFWVRRQSELEAEAGVDGGGHEARLTQEFADYQAEALNRVSPTARGYLQARMEGLQTSLLSRALEFERGRRVAATVRAFADTQDKSLAAVYQDAAQFEPAIGDLSGLIKANGYLPADKKAELLRSMEAQAATSLLAGMIDRGELDAAQARLASGQFNAALGPRGLNQMSDQLQRARDREERLAAQAERTRLAQLAVKVRAGIRDDLAAAEFQGTGAGRGGAWLVGDDQVLEVYGPERGAEILDQRDAARELHSARLAIRTASPEDEARLLSESAPQAGAGYAKGVRRFAALQRAYNEKAAGLSKSPGDWVLQNEPAVVAAFRDAGTNEGGLIAAGRLSLEVQTRMGVPAERREILGRTQAAQIVSRLNAASPDEAVSALDREGLPKQYGAELWPVVYGELQRAGLAGAVIALPLVADPVAKSDLAIAVRTPRDDLIRAVRPDDAKEIEKKLGDAFVPLRRSLGRAIDGAQRGNDLFDAAQRLALRYVGQGRSASEAAVQAFDRIVGDRYEFDGADGFRVVRPMTPGDMRRAVDALLSSLTPADLAAPAAGRDGLPDEQRREQLLATLRAGGMMLANNETDSGVVLLDRAGTPVRRANGSPIEIGTRDVPALLNAAAARGAAEARAAAATTDAEREAAQRAIREAGAAMWQALTSSSDERFADRFRRTMTQPSASWFPDQPLTSNVDLLDVARRAFTSRDIQTMAPAERDRVLQQLDRTDPRLAARLRQQLREAGGAP